MDNITIYGQNESTGEISFLPYRGSGTGLVLKIANGDVEWNDILNKPTFSQVATSGEYSDLLNAPALATVATSGEYSDLLNAPALATVATSGSYDDLTNKPSISAVGLSGEYIDLLNAPVLATVATSGSYDDLTNKPSISAVGLSGEYIDLLNAPVLATVATSGSYDDLTNKPSISAVGLSGEYTDLLNVPVLATVATSGEYTDLLNVPVLATVATSGEYTDLLNAPVLATVATSGSYDDLTNKPNISAVGLSGEYIDLLNAPALATVATSGSYDDLTNKPSISAVGLSGEYSDILNAPALAPVATSGSYDDLTDKPDFLQNVVIVNESETTLGAALTANPGQALHFQLSTGSFTEGGPINITNQNINISSLASALTATLCQITQAQVNLNASAFRVRLANIQFDGVLQIATSSSNVNHSLVNCLMTNSLTILSGTVSTGSRFLRFTDCEIKNLTIGEVSGCDIYFTRCTFSGTFQNNMTTPNKVFLIDCTGIPFNLYGLAVLAGQTQYTNQSVDVDFGYGSAARLRTTVLSDITNSNLSFINELGQTRTILDSTSKIANNQLVNSSFTLDNNTIQLGSVVGPFSLAAWQGYTAANISGQLTNSQLANSSFTLDGNTLTLGSTYSPFSLANWSGYTTAALSGTIANNQLANSSFTLDGNTLTLGSTYSPFSLANWSGYKTSALDGTITNTQLAGSITNDKLVNSSITFNGNTVALGSSAIIPIDQLGNVSISYTGIENHSVLCYHTQDSIWQPHKLSYGDLTDINVPTNTANGNIIFYNSATQNLESTQTPNVAALVFRNSNILIGRQTVLNGTAPGNSIVLNTTSTPIATNSGVSGQFFISNVSIRNGAGGTQRLKYNDILQEVGRVDDTLENLSNVGNSADSIDGGPVRYITGGTYAARCAQYWSYAGYGQLTSYTLAGTERPILRTDGTGTWASFTPNNVYTQPSGKFTHDTATGILSGFDSTKHYKVEFHVSQNGNNINPAVSWFAKIRQNNSSGAIIRDVRISQATDDRAPSLHAVVIITDITALYFGYGLSGTYTTTQNPDCQISICCHEL